jgi:phytoene dehydrogenase-like protein
LVVSDAGAWNTFSRLLPESFPLPFREELAVLPETAEVVELFLGLRGDPRQLGFQGENHWIFTSFDHDEMYQRRNELADGRAAWAYLSFPSLKNSSETSKTRGHTAEIVAPLAHRVFEAFRGQPWHHRAPDYACAKQRITDALLGLIEQHHAGFRALVEYAELATPLTFEHFTAAPRGSIYGYPGIPERYRKSWLGVDTPVRNLYLTGADASSPGIMGALMGGVATASRLLGPLGFLKAMSAAYSDTTRSSGRPYTNPDTSVETAR